MKLESGLTEVSACTNNGKSNKTHFVVCLFLSSLYFSAFTTKALRKAFRCKCSESPVCQAFLCKCSESPVFETFRCKCNESPVFQAFRCKCNEMSGITYFVVSTKWLMNFLNCLLKQRKTFLIIGSTRKNNISKKNFNCCSALLNKQGNYDSFQRLSPSFKISIFAFRARIGIKHNN